MSEKINKTEFEKMLERKAAEEEALKKCANTDSTSSTQTDDRECQQSDTPEELEQTKQALIAQQTECDQLKDQMLRARADFDNYRKRMLREMDQVRQMASANLIRTLLPVLDNLERALSHASEDDGLTEGVRMVYKQFQDILVAEGLEPIAAQGEPFDPNIHDALAAMPSESIPQGIVVEEYERGYKLRETILRPAKVIVSAGPEDAGPNENEANALEDARNDDEVSSLE